MSLCAHHTQVYATRAKALRNAVRHPGAAKALRGEALVVARQCRTCPEEWR